MANPYFIVNENTMEPFDMLINPELTRMDEMPETREEADTIAGQDGEIPLENTYGPRLFDFVLRSRDGLSVNEKQELKALLHAKLNAARKKDVELLFLQTRRTYYVRFCGRFEILEERPDWFECRVPLKAYDPYGYESIVKRIRGPMELLNKGNEAADTTIRIAGPSVNPSFVAGDSRYHYEGTVAEGETLIIRSKEQTAYLESEKSETNVTDKWCGQFLQLPVGTTYFLADYNISIQWNNRWI